MSESTYLILVILIASVITVLTRFLPFLLFPDVKHTPNYINYLGKVLPSAMIGMLVIYCFKGVDLLSSPHGIPEVIAGVLVILLHRWKKNTLLSIGAGTICYMLLVQFVF